MATPAEVSLRNRIGAHALHSKYDSRDLTKNARAASPGSISHWEDEVDPNRVLDPVERARRAKHALKAHMARLALKSAQARKKAP